MPENKNRIFTVSALTSAIKTLIESSAVNTVFVEGEISGFKLYGSGHAYFSLKDSGAVISCVMFAGAIARCACRDRLKDGEKVRFWGQVEVYAPHGNYQLVVRQAWPAGIGDLMAKFNELKAKLEREGLFSQERKRRLPILPHRVALVTSSSGAVVHDMVTVLTRRFPNLEIRLYPVRVQGNGAAEEIAAGVAFFNAAADGWVPDVMIVGRGGGSVEDLWAFNEEAVVRAVAASHIPVVSAVGHETDFTLCDFAADVRAGTPSIAAELVAPEKEKLTAAVLDLSARLIRIPMRMTETHTQTVDYLYTRLASAVKTATASYESRISAAAARLAPALKSAASAVETRSAAAGARLLPALRSAVMSAEARAASAEARIAPALEKGIATADSALRDASTRLRLLNPYDVLKRGYSITTGADGHVIRAATEVKCGDAISTRFADGAVESVVN